jgi:hypothetical protein
MIFVLYCSYIGSLFRLSLLFSAQHDKRGAAATERAWNICPVPLQDEALSFQLLFLFFFRKLTTLLIRGIFGFLLAHAN